MDHFCCLTAGSVPLALKFWLFSLTSSSWYANDDVQFQQVIVAAVFCRAMLELKTISAAMCNEIGCICGISANS
jgi:hypothetical protein